jgi:hypothetical protein
MKNARRPRLHATTATAPHRPMAPVVKFLLVIVGVLVVGKLVGQLAPATIVAAFGVIWKFLLSKALEPVWRRLSDTARSQTAVRRRA